METTEAKKPKTLGEQVAEMTGPTPEQKEEAKRSVAALLPDAKPQTLKLSQIIEAATNPRKDWGDIKALAASIESLGLIQRLIVRPLDGDRFELVAGARRLRALKMIGAKEAACDVIDVSDAMQAEARLVENCQRKDVNAMEEAEDFDRLHKVHHYSAPQIGQKVGKSQGHVFARMKLLALGPEGRTAMRSGLLSPTLAVPLARVPQHKRQAQALLRLCPKGSEPMSVRDGLQFLQSEFTQSLKGAPFDLKDAALVDFKFPSGQMAGACTKCTYRSGSTPGLFEDIPKGHDVCTLTKCYQAKCSAAWEAASAKAAERGLDVLSVSEGKKIFSRGSELSYQSDYVLANAPADGDPKKRSWKELVGKLDEDKRPKLLFAPDRTLKGRELFKRDEALKSIAKDQKWAAKEVKHDRSNGSWSPEKQEKMQEDRSFRESVLAQLVAKAVDGVDELGLPQLRIIALDANHGADVHNVAERLMLEERDVEAWILEKASAKQLSAFIYELAIRHFIGGGWGEYSENAKALAERSKFDIKAAEKALRDDAKKSEAKPSEPEAAKEVA